MINTLSMFCHLLTPIIRRNIAQIIEDTPILYTQQILL
jgi:hypothetical protein